MSPTIDEVMYDEQSMDLVAGTAAFSTNGDADMRFADDSPVEDTSGMDDPADMHRTNGIGLPTLLSNGGAATGGIVGKPIQTNNFVSKLYQMINDPKSAQYITWTELGTSFVVSNVGEFSRSILGSHFKHNNFSSFVRQLNMYGFHKINRTPRAQRTSTDAQTWEFSHHKFLRGRPDLLDEIKRKALEPDPSIKHRIELPGEVAAQLGAMRDTNRRLWEQLAAERRRTERLVSLVGRLWDVVAKGFPGSVPPFPTDLLEPIDSPNIVVTSPPEPRYDMSNMSLNIPQTLQIQHALNSQSPSSSSSPTSPEFPSPSMHRHQHPAHTLSRQHSFHHMSFSRGDGLNRAPPSPPSSTMDPFDESVEDGGDGRLGSKRQRMSDELHLAALNGAPAIEARRPSRARSDSAPLGFSFQANNVQHQQAWHPNGVATIRPPSVGGFAPGSRSMGMPSVPAIPNLHHNLAPRTSLPMLSIPTVPPVPSSDYSPQ